mmetsp:Transcript_1836/g.1756  ORF Transcript_1836/g.1756 Transcript_1836/m.1756 type:complete len:86 (-) Transcript_1836:262-519(-)
MSESRFDNDYYRMVDNLTQYVRTQQFTSPPKATLHTSSSVESIERRKSGERRSILKNSQNRSTSNHEDDEKQAPPAQISWLSAAP